MCILRSCVQVAEGGIPKDQQCNCNLSSATISYFFFFITPDLQNKTAFCLTSPILFSSSNCITMLECEWWTEWSRKGNTPSFWCTFPGSLNSGLACGSLKSGRKLEGFGVDFQSLAVPPALNKVCEGSSGLCCPPDSPVWQEHGLASPCQARAVTFSSEQAALQKQPQISSDNNKTGKELLAHR